MTNSAKASVWDVVWNAWGAPYSITGAQTLNARFPGQWYQLEAGLNYNWHRHYDPTLGRYTQPDPLGFADGPSDYAYAGNSPLELADQKGLFTDEYGKDWKVPEDMPTADTDCWTAYFYVQFVCKLPNRACKPTDSCDVLEQKLTGRLACITTQKRVNVCYGDDANDAHGNRFPDEDRGAQRCIDLKKIRNCNQCTTIPQ